MSVKIAVSHSLIRDRRNTLNTHVGVPRHRNVGATPRRVSRRKEIVTWHTQSATSVLHTKSREITHALRYNIFHTEYTRLNSHQPETRIKFGYTVHWHPLINAWPYPVLTSCSCWWWWWCCRRRRCRCRQSNDLDKFHYS